MTTIIFDLVVLQVAMTKVDKRGYVFNELILFSEVCRAS